MNIKKGTGYFFSILLIILLGFAVYANSLNGEFIWDDNNHITNNSYIKTWEHLPEIFSKNMGDSAGEKYNFYRPIQSLSYMIDYSFWKLNVKGYHLTNILLHILCGVLIYILLRYVVGAIPCGCPELGRQEGRLPLLSALLWTIHPIHTEAVAYISGRADLLALLFMLLSFIVYIKLQCHCESETRSNLVQGRLLRQSLCSFLAMTIVLFSYALALLSRESALILPILLLLYHYSFRKKINISQFSPLLVITFCYIILRLTVLKQILSDVVLPSTTLMQRLPGFFSALTDYIRLLFLPFNLHMEYDYGSKMVSFTEPKALLGMLIFYALLVWALKKDKKNKIIFFSISWFIITLLPVSNIYPVNAYMAEHWLYLPSIGFFILLGYGLFYLINKLCYSCESGRTWKKFNLLLVTCNLLVVTCICFYAYLTVKQNNYWSEPLTFYYRTLKYAPNNAKMYYNLGNEYRKNNMLKEAIDVYLKSIKINPYYAKAYYNLGVVYDKLGKKREASKLYEKTIELNPEFINAYNNLAVLNKNNKKEAIRLFKKIIEIDDECAFAYNNLSIIYFNNKQYNLAVKYYNKAKRLGFNNSVLEGALEPYK